VDVKVELRTGGRLVTREMVPPQIPAPRVIVWGSRTFQLAERDGISEVTDDGAYVYNEVAVWHVPSKGEGLSPIGLYTEEWT
jgi:hypothetical protein